MADYIKAIAKFKADPVLFVETLLGAKPQPHQADAMRAVAAGHRQISIRSGRRVGKTTLMAWLSLWFEMTRADARTIVTAPSSAQLMDAYIPSFRQWVQRLPEELFNLWDVKAERFDFRLNPRQGFENFVTVRTARKDQPESLQGINAPNVLVLVDEAAGVDDPNFEALSGSLGTRNACMVLTGNPNRNSGYFYDTHHKLRDFWYTMHVNSEDCPSVSRAWIEEMRVKWGEASNPYRIHVQGEFPTADDDTVIPMHLIEAAMDRDIQPNSMTPVVWGLDVAYFGDDASVLRKRRGNVVLADKRVWRNLDTQQLAGAVIVEYKNTPVEDRPLEILVDVIGIGAGVVDRLRAEGLPVRGVNVSESPAVNGDMYLNLRAELWFEVLAWLSRRDTKLPRDEQLRAELAMVKRDYTPQGKQKIESKKDIKRRGAGSPDDADALVLTFASTGATLIHGWNFDQKKPIKRNIKGIV